MKKVVTLLILVLAIGLVNAQETSTSVKQKVDQKIAKWENQLSVTADQKVEITAIMIKYETLMENEYKTANTTKISKEELNSNVANFKSKMHAEIDGVLTEDQRAQVEAIKGRTK
jgi:gas vesicle protein